MTRWLQSYPVVLLITVAIMTAMVGRQDSRFPIFDEFRYLETAGQLHIHGNFARVNPLRGPADSSMKEAPVTPFAIAGFMALDQTLADTLNCFLAHDLKGDNKEPTCKRDYGIYIPVLTLLMAFAASMTWLIARQAGLSVGISWLALILALASNEFAYFVPTFLTEPWLLLFLAIMFFGLSLIFSASPSSRKTLSGAIISGMALALCTLTREGYTPLAGFLPLLVFVLLYLSTRSQSGSGGAFRQALTVTTVIVVSYFLTQAPWLLRNLIMFDSLALVDGHGAHVIVERISFNRMTLQEWFAGWIFWLPDFGDKLGPALFGVDAVERLKFFGEDSFYLYGNNEMQQIINAEMAAAGETDRLSYVVKNHILADIWTHIGVTFVLVWRGLWIGDNFGLIGQFMAIFGFISMVKSGKTAFAIMLVFTALFMVGLHAFVSVSLPRYNLIMIPYIAILTAIAFGKIAIAIKQRIALRKT